MYAYIKGKIIAHEEDGLILDNHGIGYRILSAPELLPVFGAPGGETCAFTSLVIRDNLQALYGFPTREYCALFELLQTVSGIGPKVAALILGRFTPDRFALAVLAGDIQSLTRVKGLGKKGAERLVLELKDKLKKTAGGDGGATGEGEPIPADETGGDLKKDVLSALLVLGYSERQAAETVKRTYQVEQSLEDNVRLALRELAKQF